jgi:hypothetical protein
MAGSSARVATARLLAHLSQALADALESGDLEAAERFLAERALALEQVPITSLPSGPPDAEALAEARATVEAAERRSHSLLTRALEATHAELGDLAHGARAMRAYLPAEPLAPGFVDRHD